MGEDIIQRDFFAHIAYLHNKLEWLEAIRSKNKNYIYKAQHNIAARLSYHQIFNIKTTNNLVSISEKKIKRKELIKKSFKTNKFYFNDLVILKESPIIGIYILSSILIDEFCAI